MKLKFYEYKNCSTCQKAIKFLDAHLISYQRLAIAQQPPTLSELKQMLEFLKADGGSFKNLFNSSGEQYRTLNISEKIKAGLSEDEALRLLCGNGKLIKRPFVLSEEFGVVGFKPELWKKLF